jgi:hypothetical protein
VGDLLHEQTLQSGDIRTTALSFALKGDRIACGTLDGRVLVLRMKDGT